MRGALRREISSLAVGWRFRLFLVGSAAYAAWSLEDVLTPRSPVIPSVWTAFPAFVEACLVLVLASAFLFSLDTIARDRDSGMLAMLRVSPTPPISLVAAKALAVLGVYGIVLAVLAGTAWVAARAVGDPFFTAAVWYLLGPLTLLVVFLVGLGVFVSSIAGSARGSLVLGAGVLLLLVAAITPEAPGHVILNHLGLGWLAGWNPLKAAYVSGLSVVSGRQPLWWPLVGGAVAGLAGLLAAAHVVDARGASL